jgi:HD superfamily phosphohydrolase YqeK
VANLARQVAQMESSDPVLAEEAFTAGLLHDIGKLVLASNLDTQYNGVLSLAQKNQIPLVEVELEVFGATHADTAAYLVAVWGLPNRIVEAIALHHTPRHSEDTAFSPLAAVHIANVLEHEQGAEKDTFIKPTLDMEYLTRLGLQERIDRWRRPDRNKTSTQPSAPEPQIESPSTGRVHTEIGRRHNLLISLETCCLFGLRPGAGRSAVLDLTLSRQRRFKTRTARQSKRSPVGLLKLSLNWRLRQRRMQFHRIKSRLPHRRTPHCHLRPTLVRNSRSTAIQLLRPNQFRRALVLF